MTIWEESSSGRKTFRHGQNCSALAAEAARRCPSFMPDDDDELVCDEERSCYNCRYRRWTTDSFECICP